jgi:uncharacterized iron-regulated protein
MAAFTVTIRLIHWSAILRWRPYGNALVSSFLVALWLFAPGTAAAQSVIMPAAPSQTIAIDAVLDQLAEANVVYLGETHTQATDHEQQRLILEQLHQRVPQLIIGMEMFQRPYQAVLDAYIAGDITEAELRSQTEYDQRWGYDWDYYAPILRFAQTHQHRVLALNTPTEITRRVAEKGWLGLHPDDAQWIPPIADIDTQSAPYRQQLFDIFTQHPHGSSRDFENFFLAQVLWDETMAEAIANAVMQSPDAVVVVLAGRGHIAYGYGIPDRVERRLSSFNVQQRSLLFETDATGDRPSDPDIADFIWQASE